ncbi:MAG TPA: HAD family hydrolase [Blastocatellia bacterium]|nr:HAD family hydrolase [Blastocatellia bacterium]
MMNRAIFIDRDGTLNEEVGYIVEASQFRLYDFAAEAVRLINEANRRAIVITNQSGVARGLFDEEFLLQLHKQMETSLTREGARIDATYYCPHHPKYGESPYRRDCDCRKPKPGLIERAAKDFHLNLKESFVIGDRARDLETGHAVGTRSVMVMTGYGREEWSTSPGSNRPQPEHVAENLLEAVRWILSVS